MPTANTLAASLLAGFLICSFVGTAVAAPPTIIMKKDDAVLFQAPVNAETRDRLFALLDDTVKMVIVISGGGDPLAGIDIGREIRRRNLTVAVKDLCASACAQYIFVAAKQRAVLPDSLVLFHNTSSSMVKMIGAGEVPLATRERLTVQAKAEKAFYEEIGISDALLLEPQARILTSCYRYKDPPDGSSRDVEYKMLFHWWTPSKKYLEAVGVRVNGFWPSADTMTDAMKVARLRLGADPQWVALGDDRPMEPKMLDKMYEDFAHVCPADQAKTP